MKKRKYLKKKHLKKKKKLKKINKAFLAIFQRHRHQDKVPVPAQELH